MNKWFLQATAENAVCWFNLRVSPGWCGEFNASSVKEAAPPHGRWGVADRTAARWDTAAFHLASLLCLSALQTSNWIISLLSKRNLFNFSNSRSEKAKFLLLLILYGHHCLPVRSGGTAAVAVKHQLITLLPAVIAILLPIIMIRSQRTNQ